MSNYCLVSPAFWARGSGKRLRGDSVAQVVALYLLTYPASNYIGLSHLALPTICHETGLSEELVRGALKRIAAQDFAHYDEAAELVWIPNAAELRIGPVMKSGDKRRALIQRELAAAGKHPFVDQFMARYGASYLLSTTTSGSPLEGASEPLSDLIPSLSDLNSRSFDLDPDLPGRREAPAVTVPHDVQLRGAPAPNQLPTAALERLEGKAIAGGWPSPHEEWPACRDYYRARGEIMADWEACFAAWLRRAKRYGPRDRPSGVVQSAQNRAWKPAKERDLADVDDIKPAAG